MDPIARFDALWRKRWGSDAEPLGWWLRGGPTWTRFHSLPGGKRYADTESERAEVMDRHMTLIRSLAGQNSDQLIIIASDSRSDSGEKRWVQNAFPDAVQWRDERVDDEGRSTAPLMISFGPNRLHSIVSVIQSVADDEIESLAITDETLDWLYCPYDGGADVFARSQVERDRLRVAYRDWSPQNIRGL